MEAGFGELLLSSAAFGLIGASDFSSALLGCAGCAGSSGVAASAGEALFSGLARRAVVVGLSMALGPGSDLMPAPRGFTTCAGLCGARTAGAGALGTSTDLVAGAGDFVTLDVVFLIAVMVKGGV